MSKNIKRSFNLRVSWDDALMEELQNQKKIEERIEMIKTIIELRKVNKETLEKIGHKYGLSRERIRQVLKQFGLDGLVKN